MFTQYEITRGKIFHRLIAYSWISLLLDYGRSNKDSWAFTLKIGTNLSPIDFITKYSTPSEEPGFLLFHCKRKHFLNSQEIIKTRHSRDSSHGSPAFLAGVLTVRLPWYVLIISIFSTLWVAFGFHLFLAAFL